LPQSHKAGWAVALFTGRNSSSQVSQGCEPLQHPPPLSFGPARWKGHWPHAVTGLALSVIRATASARRLLFRAILLGGI
jgi:hypothetical protein